MNTLHQPPQTRSTGAFSQRGRSQVALIGAEVVWSKLDGISPISNTRPVCVPCRRANWRTGSCGSVAGHHASRGGKARSYEAVPLSRQLACTLAGLQGTCGWWCEECGIAQGTEQISRHTGTCYRVAQHAAHLDHDPVNPCPRRKRDVSPLPWALWLPLWRAAALACARHAETSALLASAAERSRGMIDVQKPLRFSCPLPIAQTPLGGAGMSPERRAHSYPCQEG